MAFFDKIKAGLSKTRDALSNTLGSVFSGFSEIDDDFYDELEESLILADLGVDTAVKATDALRKAVRENHLKTTEEAKQTLKEILVGMLNVGDTALNLSTTPSVILVIGVNGVSCCLGSKSRGTGNAGVNLDNRIFQRIGVKRKLNITTT